MIDKSFCIGCQVVTTKLAGFGTTNIVASQGCWELFSLAVKNYFNFEIKSTITLSKMSATYGLQHGSHASAQSIKSIHISLTTLYYFLVEGLNEEEASMKRNNCLQNTLKYDLLDPPEAFGQLTIAHVLSARDAYNFELKVSEWSESVWQSWYKKHYYQIESLIVV